MSRNLDNTAKVFSLEEKRNNNTFRFSVILKEKIDSKMLKLAVIKTLNIYPSYKVKIKSGFFWDYLETNLKEPIIEKEIVNSVKSINLSKNNDYLFKVTYINNKINLDVCHILTDGLGTIILLKGILYNYLNLKYNLKTNSKEIFKDTGFTKDEYLKNADKRLVSKKLHRKSFLIKEKSNSEVNKTYHYTLDLQKLKNICKKNSTSISEYLTTLYIYTIYKTIYDIKSNKDISVTVPIDLRKYYNVQTFSNFFTCMTIEANILNNKNISFEKILKQVHTEFKTKLTQDNIKRYLSRDVKLGTNIAIELIPLFIKKPFMRFFGKFVGDPSTTTLSNVGPIIVDEQYKKYIDNIKVSVSPGQIQKIKCTICSYENNLTITINSNLINNRFEEEFYKLLMKHIGKVKLESNTR